MGISPFSEESCVLCSFIEDSFIEGTPFFLDTSGMLAEGGRTSSQRALPTEEEVAAIGAIICFLEQGGRSNSSTWGNQARVEVLR